MSFLLMLAILVVIVPIIYYHKQYAHRTTGFFDDRLVTMMTDTGF